MVHTFQYQNQYFALDVETGSIHGVDKAAHDAIRALAEAEAAGGRVQDELNGSAMHREIKALIDAGLLFSKEETQANGDASEGVFKAMCLHLAHDCNLRCDYCFAEGGAFAGRRELMSADVAKAAIDWLVNASGQRRNLEIDFFGGEPLMNFDVLKQTVAYARSLEQAHGKHFRFTVTTNAYHITDEMKTYLDENMNNIVVSIDGRKEVHDAVRKTAGGKGSYDCVAENAKKLTLHRDGEYYIRGTFTADNLDFSKDVLHIADMGFAGVSIEPVVTAGGNAITEEHLPEIYAEYEKLADEYVKREESGSGFTFFHFMVDLDAGPCKLKRIRGCGAGTEYVAVAPNGEVSPCHQFVGQEDFLLGSVFAPNVDQAVAGKLAACDIYHMDDCQSCWAKYYCSGGCAAANFNINGDIMKPYEIGCKMQRKRLELAIGMAAQRRMEEA